MTATALVGILMVQREESKELDSQAWELKNLTPHGRVRGNLTPGGRVKENLLGSFQDPVGHGNCSSKAPSSFPRKLLGATPPLCPWKGWKEYDLVNRPAANL